MTRSVPALQRIATVVGATVLTLALVAVGIAVGAARYLTVPMEHEGDYVLLVLGSDEGPPRAGSVLTGRADGFHVVVVTADQKHATVMSFPRDTWVDIPGLGRNKINASLTRGPETAVRTAELVTGLEVDDWIVTGFDGMILLVGALGGVHIDVETRLSHLSTIEPGPQRLGGTSALSYLRDRKSRAGGDFDRAESHGRFLKAVHEQVVNEDVGLDRMMDLVAALDTYTESSLSTAEMVQLAGVALRIPPENVQRIRIDGRVGTAGSASVVHLTDAAHRVFEDVRTDGVLGELPVGP